MNQLEKSIQNLSGEINPEIVFVAVSAGVDSTLLLELASTYFKVIALHVNYKLRGEASDLDQAFLEDFCLKKRIPFNVKVHDLKTELQLKSSNLQNRAREIRYEFFKENLSKHENSVLFLGHHADDQIETFFINYFRNSGIAGLSGMKQQNGKFFRPFLMFSKKEISTLAIEKKLAWREDQSNVKNDYLRNRFRNEIIPELENQIPSLKSSVLHLMNILQENQIQLEKEIEIFIKNMKINANIPLSEFVLWGDERWIEVLRQFGLSTGFLKEFKKLLQSRKGAKLNFPTNERIESVIREKDSLYFVLYKGKKDEPPTIKSTIVCELPKDFSKEVVYLDDSKMDGELILRKWRQGDRIYPIGINGSKLISDVLTDAKVPHVERDNKWLLCDNSKIISCIGFCIDRRAIATKNSKKIRCIEIAQS
ncbi:MAG: tRNA lysidine(34) synthetase TilS [Bacteroidota bacterium]